MVVGKAVVEGCIAESCISQELLQFHFGKSDLRSGDRILVNPIVRATRVRLWGTSPEVQAQPVLYRKDQVATRRQSTSGEFEESQAGSSWIFPWKDVNRRVLQYPDDHYEIVFRGKGMGLQVLAQNCYIVQVTASLPGNLGPDGTRLYGVDPGEGLPQVASNGPAPGSQLQDGAIRWQVQALENRGATRSEMVVGGDILDVLHHFIRIERDVLGLLQSREHVSLRFHPI